MYNLLSTLRISTLVLIILLISAVSAMSQKFGKITDEDRAIGPPADYAEANAVVVFHKGSIEFKRKKVVVHYHKRIKILTEAGVEEAGEQSIEYWTWRTKLKGFKAHTITPDGKKHKVEKDAIFEKSISADWVEKSFAFPALEVGTIIEYRYEIHTENFYYLNSWYFQDELYTMRSEITANVALGFDYDITYANVPRDRRNPEVESRPDPVTGLHSKAFTWTVENLMPSKEEPYTGCINDYRAAVKFQLNSYRTRDGTLINYTKNWNEEGDWFERMFLEDYCDADGRAQKIAREITEGLTTSKEKSETIFKYVESEYGNSDEYINKYFVHERMSRLLDDNNGAPEGKNLLMVKMHQAVDIPCWPVLISTRKNGAFNPKVPGTRQFNYLIAVVQLGEHEWEFLDASDRHSIYGVLAPMCLTTGGFLIDGNSSALVDMTIKPLESKRTDITDVYVSADGHAACTTDCKFTGYYGSSYASRYDRNTPEEFIEEYYEDRLDVAWEIGKYTCTLDSANAFRVCLDFDSEDLVKKLDNNLLVSQVGFAFRDNPFKAKQRVFPIDFSYPFVYENIVRIHPDGIPTDYTLPEDILLEVDGALFRRTSRAEGTCVVVRSTLEIYKPLFKPHRYRDIRKIFDQMALAGEDQVAFVMSDTQ